MKPLFLLPLLAGLACAHAAEPFSPVACEGTYPRHLQGICTDDQDAIYWCWTDFLVKTDPAGMTIVKP